MEQNPELAHIFNNPQMLRESLQMANNPVCHFWTSHLFSFVILAVPFLTDACWVACLAGCGHDGHYLRPEKLAKASFLTPFKYFDISLERVAVSKVQSKVQGSGCSKSRVVVKKCFDGFKAETLATSSG